MNDTALKILVLSQYWWPENGVPQRRWAWLSQILIDAGHEITVIAPPPHYQRKMSMKEWWGNRRARTRRGKSAPVKGSVGERIIRSGFIPAGPSLTQRILNQATVALGALWAVLRKPGQLRGYTPDLIIGTVPALPTAVVTFFASKALGAPYVIDLRDAWPDLLQESDKWNKGTGRTSLRERVLRRGPLQALTAATRRAMYGSLKNAHALMVTSSHLAEDIRQRPAVQTNGRAPEIVTVRNVFPPETNFQKTKREETERNGLNVLYAGTLGRAQNLANAIHAAVIAKDRGINVSLTFVGAGVAKPALQKLSQDLGVDLVFDPQHGASELEKYYDWADTALVHLTDWEALDMAVPSKTYELMGVGMHISAAVGGETAALIRDLKAGDVVEPENPEALAQLWCELAEDRSRLNVGEDAGEWVENQRRNVAPAQVLSLVEGIGAGRN